MSWIVLAGAVATADDRPTERPTEKPADAAKPDSIAVTGVAEIRYTGPMVGERVEQEAFENVAVFSGTGEQRHIALNPLVIERDATVWVMPERGSFRMQSGAVSIPSLVKVKFGFFSTEERVVLTTGAVTSGGNYSGSGVPFDPKTRKIVLVAAGTSSGYEFFVQVTATLARAPLASEKPAPTAPDVRDVRDVPPETKAIEKPAAKAKPATKPATKPAKKPAAKQPTKPSSKPAAR